MKKSTKSLNIDLGEASVETTSVLSTTDAADPVPGPGGITYKGARYITKFAEPIEWNQNSSYEYLTVVQHEGDSYVSKQNVPAGVSIDDTAYWLHWADYNAQIEQYRKEVQEVRTDIAELDQRVTDAEGKVDAMDARVTAVEGKVTKVQNDLATEVTRAKAAENDIKISVQNLGSSLNEEETRATNAEAALERQIDLSALPSRIFNAKPFARIQVAKKDTSGIEGGCVSPNGSFYVVCKSDDFSTSFTISVIKNGSAVANKVVSGNHTANQVAIERKSGNVFSILVSGSSSSASGNLVYQFTFDASNNTLTQGTSLDTKTFDVESVWGFGYYDASTYWYTPDLGTIYTINRNLEKTSIKKLCVNPIMLEDYISVQQAITWCSELKVFISCRSNSVDLFDNAGNLIKHCAFESRLGYIWREELEQVSYANGEFWFHNNDYEWRSWEATPVATIWSTPIDGSIPGLWIDTGNPSRLFTINVGTDQPEFIKPQNNIVGTIGIRYPKDLACYLSYPEASKYNAIGLTTDMPDTVIINGGSNQIYTANKKLGGIAVFNGSCSVYDCAGALSAPDYWLNDAWMYVADGGTSGIYTELPSISSSKKFVACYGGVVTLRNKSSKDNPNRGSNFAVALIDG